MDIQVTEIKCQKEPRQLVVHFSSGESFSLPFEYLRVFSPSAEVRGHGLDEPLLVAKKKEVNIEAIEPVGHYAIQIMFDDGHTTGIYSWDFLYQLGKNQETNWSRYLERLEQAGKTR